MYIRIPDFLKEKNKKVCVSLCLFLTLCCIAAYSKDEAENPVLSYGIASKIIVVDPGHGGFDPGAWRGDIKEKDITLQIAKKLQRHLSEAGAMVVLLRENDDDLAADNFSGTVRERKRQDLANRVKKAREAKADLFISVHTNADPSPRWSGAQTFYNAKSETSKMIAETIQDELTRILGNTTRKAKTGSYYIIDKTEMPAVIVEVGFISNAEEARLLTDSGYQNKVAYAIFSGIVKSQQVEPTEKVRTLRGDD